MNYARAGRIPISKTAVDRPASRSELRTNFSVLFHRSAAKQEYFADDVIRAPFYKTLAVEVNNTSWICVAMLQLLGQATGSPARILPPIGRNGRIPSLEF